MNHNQRYSRRDVLRLAALGFIGAMIAACQRAVEPLTGGNAPAPAPTKDINSRGAPPPQTQTVADSVPVTPNADFYTVWYESGAVPKVPPNWKLTITGQVGKEIALTLDDLKAMPAVTEMRTLECISNPVGGDLISNAVWKGVRLKDLLAQAGTKPGAKGLKLESFDGYSTGIPIDLGMHEHALLVYEMNGEPLPGEHGAPLRCLWPGRYGMKQPKWIQTITVSNSDYAGFWEKQGWSNDAFVLPNSRIDSPPDLAVISAPTFALSGVAYSGEDGIAKIEIGWDDSNQWLPADLTRGPSAYNWTLWKWTGQSLPAGRHQMYARVTDNRGRMQTKGQAFNLLGDTFPNGTSDMHSIVLDFKG
ncbi:MAG: molybdopterin-dependent oxidoreductase [Chloroflexota bacterium]|nr:molybdopterin-dependent oxidoreductase [Chloroflexota bacterium]